MAKGKETVIDKIKKNEERMHERVKIRLHKDRHNIDPLYVSVMGYNARIPRGVDVMIPRFAAEVIRQSMEQDADTQIRIEEQERKSFDL